MGRIALIFILFLFLTQISFGYEISYNKQFEKYYFGGEYLFFEISVSPESNKEKENLNGAYYEVYTALENSGIVVQIISPTKILFHPISKDEYRWENGTYLRFYLPEIEVSKLKIKIFGYVPEISTRIKTVQATKIIINSEKLHEKGIKVVNKHIFYKNIKNLEKNACNEDLKTKLDEILSLYYGGKYIEADEKLREVRVEIEACKLESKSEELMEKLGELKNELLDVRRNLTSLSLDLEFNKSKIANYDQLKLKLENLTKDYERIDLTVDEVDKLIDVEKFDVAEEKIKNLKTDISILKDKIYKFSKELSESTNKSERFPLIPVLVVLIILLVIAVLYVLVRTKR